MAGPAGSFAADAGVCEGERLGLYEALARIGPATVQGLAREALLPVTHVYAWLEAQARDGYLHHDAYDGKYNLWCELWCEWPRAGSAEGDFDEGR